MKVHLRVTNLETGSVNKISLEAESEAAALEKYKASPNLSAELAPPEEPPTFFSMKMTKEFERALKVFFGLIFLLVFFVVTTITFEQSGHTSDEAMQLATVALGSFVVVFFVIYYLRKIANKRA